MSKFSYQDEVFMKRALELAAKASGHTSPNPLVGAVLVKKGKIIAEGYHRRAGGDHAEVVALKKLSAADVKGAVLYVTLEPCAHYGRTPPCTDFLIQKGVGHIVVAMGDPHPLVQGKGLRQLRQAGIKVEVGLLQKEAEALNETFIYAVQHRRSFVLVKMAMTLDGKIATSNGDALWISNEMSRKEVHRLRSQVDAILTTANTVLSDDPHLGVRMVKGRDPLRIVLDADLRTAPSAKVYRDRNVLVVTCEQVNARYQARLRFFEKADIQLLAYKRKPIALRKLLGNLYKRGIVSIMVEAGAGLFTELLKQKLAQKGCFFIAPKIVGGNFVMVKELGIKKMSRALRLHHPTAQLFDEDICIQGYF